MSNKNKWIIAGVVLFVIILTSFEIGYLVAKQANPAPIIIEKNIN